MRKIFSSYSEISKTDDQYDNLIRDEIDQEIIKLIVEASLQQNKNQVADQAVKGTDDDSVVD
jgi:hypothetical protein